MRGALSMPGVSAAGAHIPRNPPRNRLDELSGKPAAGVGRGLQAGRQALERTGRLRQRAQTITLSEPKKEGVGAAVGKGASRAHRSGKC